jgi:anti-anti-sigma regulatory factor
VKKITVYREDGIDVVEAVGELDMSNVAQLDKALKAALSDEMSSCCPLGLSGLAFLDSTVINTLARWSRDVQLQPA